MRSVSVTLRISLDAVKQPDVAPFQLNEELKWRTGLS